MKKYFNKISTINQNHPDASDLGRFFSLCEEFLKQPENRTPETRNEILNLFNNSKNKTIKNQTILLLSYFPEEIQIDFSDEESLNSYLFFLSFNKRHLKYKNEIVDLLNKNIFADNLYLLLKNEEFSEEKKEFIHSEANIIDKFRLMIFTNYFCNMNLFSKFLGDKDAYVCFLAYEAFSLFLKKNFFSFFDIEVENQNNFLFYSFELLKEKKEIKEKIQKNDLEKVKLLLKKYLKNVDKIEINDKIKRLKLFNKKEINFENKVEEEDFEYLFENNSYKAICDCIEI